MIIVNPYYAALSHQDISRRFKSLTHAIASGDKNYFRIGLNRTVTATFDKFEIKIKESHLSFYEKFDPHNILAGMCHYTALLEINRESFRLHVYLNQDDKATRVRWERAVNKQYTLLTNIPEECNAVLQDANSQINTIIRILRPMLVDKIKELDTKFQDLDKERNTLSIKRHSQPYITLCERQQKIALQLKDLTGFNTIWQGNANSVNEIKQKLLEERTTKENTVSAASPERPPGVIPTQTSPVNPSLRKLAKRSYSENSALSLMQIINENYEQLLKTEEERQKLKRLNALYCQIGEMQLTDRSTLSSDNLIALYQVEKNTENCAKQMLQTALANGRISDAQEMSKFFHMLNPDVLLNQSLQNHDAALLKFVINDLWNKSNVSLNNCSVTIEGKTYQNPLVYCMRFPSPELSACFAVLVRSGINLMEPLKIKGLPIVFHILHSKDHPYHKELLKEKDFKHNKVFYLQLINILSRHSQKKTGLEEKEKLKLFVKVIVKKLSTANAVFAPEIIEKINSFSVVLTSQEQKILTENAKIKKFRKLINEGAKTVALQNAELLQKYAGHRYAIQARSKEYVDRVQNAIENLDKEEVPENISEVVIEQLKVYLWYIECIIARNAALLSLNNKNKKANLSSLVEYEQQIKEIENLNIFPDCISRAGCVIK